MRQMTMEQMRRSRAKGHRAPDVAVQSFNVEGNGALQEDAEEQIYISPRPEQLAQTKSHGTAKQCTGRGVMRSSGIPTEMRV